MTTTRSIPVIAVVGPTASGKSGLAVALAKWLNSEVVSADSMQIYREMTIGTAKPTAEEMDGVVHHMVDFLPMTESFSVADYVAMAGECLKDIARRGKIPILVGGTGLYVRSLLQNLDFSDGDKDPALRESLRKKAETEGPSALLEELRSVDPESAERIEMRNVPRVIRAIELYRTTGKTMTEHLRDSRKTPSPYVSCMLGLNYRQRQTLYDRINRRVDDMMEKGLLDEAKNIFQQPGGQTALQAIGYKELKPYLDGEISLSEAVEKMKQGTRRYAKRQLTWFRREEDIHWLYPDDYIDEASLVDAAKSVVTQWFQKRGI
ncbi:MAG: tRNA (adenosine(37)-N6)-dimethylallyltransferase MiaA [Oscillospiraceae bacterium]|nr:tRNA (adenosine(37)-N6)-dimethylallyltransferase MiaA [Oscillospiraceae bacterium]